MIKIIFLNQNTSAIAGLKDGDVVDVSKGEMEIIAPERVKTFPCGCTRVDGQEVFHCKLSRELRRAVQKAGYKFHDNPSEENKNAIEKAINDFRQHWSITE
jgi:hypothetical protein